MQDICTKSMNLICMMTVMLNSIAWSLIFVKQGLDELEHPSLIIEWESNMNEYANKKQAKKKNIRKKKKSIVTLTGITD